VRTAAGTPDTFLDLPVELSVSQTWNVDGTLLAVRDSISAGSAVILAKDGPGELEFFGASPNHFSGTLLVRGSRLTLTKRTTCRRSPVPLCCNRTNAPAFAQVLRTGQFTIRHP
jgi:hypothetical protein